MALCADAVVKDGELIGDPTEGALVVLAEKGGLDAMATRAQYPRVAELPFDADYKMMVSDVPPDVQRRKGDKDGRPLPSSRAHPTSFPRQGNNPLAPEDLALDPGRTTSSSKRYMEENERLGEPGRLRVLATGAQGFRPEDVRSGNADLLPLLDEDLTILALVGIVDPPRSHGRRSRSRRRT